MGAEVCHDKFGGVSMLRTCLSAVLVIAFTPFGFAQTQGPSKYQQLGREIFKELVEIKSTESGVGSTPAAEAVAHRLLSAGFDSGDVLIIGPNERKKNLVARIHGKGAVRPILLLAHLDVVEARREDWSPDIDPFKLVERDGYFYGRGTQDIKDCAAILATNFIRWKQEGSTPDRDLNGPMDHDILGVASIYTALGDHDYAIAVLEKGVESRSTFAFVFVDPRLDPLRSDPRFQKLLRRTHLAS